MERQRSFSVKPTRLLLFSSTISSAFIFLTFFTVWLIKATPPVPPQHNKSSLLWGIRPVTTVQSSTGSSSNLSATAVKDSILNTTHFTKPENTSGLSGISSLRETQSPQVAVPLHEEEDKVGYGFDGNFTAMPPVEQDLSRKIEVLSSKKIEAEKIQTLSDGKVEEDKRKNGKCDFARGSWVYDESYPLYTNASCPWIDEGFDCQGNGRLDKDYMKWRWQPQDCDIPRFNATKMLELLRGKRLVFVGDSLNRNQWESMLCMLMGAIRDPSRVYETHRRRITKKKGDYSFRFVDYKCTVEYYASHFLVHESKARIGQKRKPTLKIDAIDHGSSRWRGADILIFNTAHWWSHYKTKAGINYYQEGGQVHPKLDVSTAFRKALMTWASWVDKYINPRRTRVFFRSSAPSHFRGGQWNSGGSCKDATQPLKTSSASYCEKNIIALEVQKQMKTPITFLNITGLSEYRIDGHPSIYGSKPRKSGGQDCSHWCLPGIPDIWNELLYAHLQ